MAIYLHFAKSFSPSLQAIVMYVLMLLVLTRVLQQAHLVLGKLRVV